MPLHFPAHPLKSFFHSRWFLLCGIILLGFLIIAFGKVAYLNYETHQDISALETEYGQLEDNQKKLKELSGFLQKDFFAEREARIKLGMQKKDEHAIVIQELSVDNKNEKNQNVVSVSGGDADENAIGEKSNGRIWWDYFFKVHSP